MASRSEPQPSTTTSTTSQIAPRRRSERLKAGTLTLPARTLPTTNWPPQATAVVAANSSMALRLVRTLLTPLCAFWRW